MTIAHGLHFGFHYFDHFHFNSRLSNFIQFFFNAIVLYPLALVTEFRMISAGVFLE